jgi:hypothetical protein
MRKANVTLDANGPVHAHDCPRCTYLRTLRMHGRAADLYRCTESSAATSKPCYLVRYAAPADRYTDCVCYTAESAIDAAINHLDDMQHENH